MFERPGQTGAHQRRTGRRIARYARCVRLRCGISRKLLCRKRHAALGIPYESSGMCARNAVVSRTGQLHGANTEAARACVWVVLALGEGRWDRVAEQISDVEINRRHGR